MSNRRSKRYNIGPYCSPYCQRKRRGWHLRYSPLEWVGVTFMTAVANLVIIMHMTGHKGW